MKILLILLTLMTTLSAFSAGLVKSVVRDLAPTLNEEHYLLVNDGSFEEIKLDCSSFLNHIHFKQNQQIESFFLFHEECFYLAERAYEAGIEGRPFCLQVDQHNPPFQISDDLNDCLD
jgi:hypothetical protein